MPTYEYQCTKCDRKFEVFQSITAKALKIIKTDCDMCKGKAPVIRCIGTGGGLIFKGSGFYITDYRSDTYKAAAKAESGSTADSGDKKTVDGESKKPPNEGTSAPAAAKSDSAKKEEKPGKKPKKTPSKPSGGTSE